jgi:CHASE2 domain-containing sensor protein
MTLSSSPTYRALGFVVALILASLAYLLARQSLIFAPELHAWDLLFRVRGPLPVRSDFVVVAGDARSISAFGRPPWPRRVYADVVRAVRRGDPKAIILDRFFERRDTKRRGSDDALWKAIADARDVFLPLVHSTPPSQAISRDDLRGLVALEKSTVDQPFIRLSATPDYAWLGFHPPVSDFAVSARGMGVATADQSADADGVFRRTRTGWVSPIAYPASPPLPEPSKLSGHTGVVPGLPVIAAADAFDLDKSALKYEFGDHLLIAGHLEPPVFIPIDAVGGMVINYVGPAGTVRHYSLVDVARGHVPASAFKDKRVFIGLTTGAVEDDQPLPTPYGRMPRVEITASAVHSILERNYLFVDTLRAPLGYLLGFGLVLGVLVPLFRLGTDLLVALALLLLYLALAVVSLRVWHVLLPVLPAVLLAVLFYLAILALRAVLGGRTAAVE